MRSKTRNAIAALACFVLLAGLVVWIVTRPGSGDEDYPTATAVASAISMAASTGTPVAPPTETPVAPPTEAPVTPEPTAPIEVEPTRVPQITERPTAGPTATPRPEARPTAEPTTLPTAAPTEKPAAGQETGRLIDYVRNSGDFVYIDRPHSPYRLMYVPKYTVSGTTDSILDSEFDWGVIVDDYRETPPYDCTIYANSYDAETRGEIEKLLERVYPTGVKQVMELVVLAIRQELWETTMDRSVSCNISGTFGTRYIDNREVHIAYAFGDTGLYIFIKDPGYINPEVPLKLTQEEIDALSYNGNGRAQDDSAIWFREVNDL